jgi:uncharacterized protein (TIRG00374 family)
MTDKKRSALKRRYLLIVVGLAVFLVYLYLFIPLGELVETVKRLNSFYFLSAFCALIASTVLYSIVWQRLLDLLSVKASFLKVFQFVWVENFVDLVIPGEPVSGEVSRIYLMSKDAGGNYGKVVASAVGQRIATTFVTSTGLVACIIYFAFTSNPPLFVLAFAGVVLLCDAMVIGICFTWLREKVQHISSPIGCSTCLLEFLKAAGNLKKQERVQRRPWIFFMRES